MPYKKNKSKKNSNAEVKVIAYYTRNTYIDTITCYIIITRIVNLFKCSEYTIEFTLAMQQILGNST